MLFLQRNCSNSFVIYFAFCLRRRLFYNGLNQYLAINYLQFQVNFRIKARIFYSKSYFLKAYTFHSHTLLLTPVLSLLRFYPPSLEQKWTVFDSKNERGENSGSYDIFSLQRVVIDSSSKARHPSHGQLSPHLRVPFSSPQPTYQKNQTGKNYSCYYQLVLHLLHSYYSIISE